MVETNRRRSRNEPEYELLDTGVFAQDPYFDVFVEYAKESPEDVLIKIMPHDRSRIGPRVCSQLSEPLGFLKFFRSQFGPQYWRKKTGFARRTFTLRLRSGFGLARSGSIRALLDWLITFTLLGTLRRLLRPSYMRASSPKPYAPR